MVTIGYEQVLALLLQCLLYLDEVDYKHENHQVQIMRVKAMSVFTIFPAQH